MPHAQVNGCRLFYAVDDFSPPWLAHETVLLQHGFTRNHQWFHAWAPLIAARGRVVRPDLRGHGDSDGTPPEGGWSLKAFADDLAGLLDHLGIERVHYVGESMGGLVGVAFAAHYPQRVRSLTLVSTPVRVPVATQRRLAGRYKDWAEAMGALGIRGAYLAVGRGVAQDAPAEARLRQAWIERQWDRMSLTAAQGIARALYRPDATIEPLLPKILAPTLILAPGHSPTATPEMQEQLAKGIPRAAIHWFRDAGHELCLDKAEECARLALEHIGAS